MGTKLQRKIELMKWISNGNSLMSLRSMACRISGRQEGFIADCEIGSTASDYIIEILDCEYPNDASVSSRSTDIFVRVRQGKLGI